MKNTWQKSFLLLGLLFGTAAFAESGMECTHQKSGAHVLIKFQAPKKADGKIKKATVEFTVDGKLVSFEAGVGMNSRRNNINATQITIISGSKELNVTKNGKKLSGAKFYYKDDVYPMKCTWLDNI